MNTLNNQPRYHLACPTCEAKPFDPCQSLTTRRTTDTHAARLALYRRPTLVPKEDG